MNELFLDHVVQGRFLQCGLLDSHRAVVSLGLELPLELIEEMRKRSIESQHCYVLCALGEVAMHGQ